MRLAEALLLQSHELVWLDSTKPKQVNLRRAISSAYYAIFHLLISDSVYRLNPKLPGKFGIKVSGPLMARMGRAFQHGDMRKVCMQFQQTSLPEAVAPLLSNGVSAELKAVAKAFLDLQEDRHTADYDAGKFYSRDDAIVAVETAERAFHIWRRIRNSDEISVFMAALAFGARWSK
jgi:uncharacterized protein (UPF0332 family)